MRLNLEVLFRRSFLLVGSGFWVVFGFLSGVPGRGWLISVDWRACRSLREVAEIRAVLGWG